MKKLKNIAVFAIVFILGIFAAYLGMLPTIAAITLIVALVILLSDYERATLIVALYTVFEFVLRSVIARPVSQILSMFGRRVYFDFISKAIESPTVFSSYWMSLLFFYALGSGFINGYGIVKKNLTVNPRLIFQFSCLWQSLLFCFLSQHPISP